MGVRLCDTLLMNSLYFEICVKRDGGSLAISMVHDRDIPMLTLLLDHRDDVNMGVVLIIQTLARSHLNGPSVSPSHRPGGADVGSVQLVYSRFAAKV